DIRIGGRSANGQYQFTVQADDLAELRAWEPRIRTAMSALPELVDVNTDQQDKGMQTTLSVDRDAAARLGVNMQTIDSTLNDVFGQRQVSTIYNPLNQYHVVMEAAPQYWQSPESLRDIYVTAGPPPVGSGANSATGAVTRNTAATGANITRSAPTPTTTGAQSPTRPTGKNTTPAGPPQPT